MKKLTKGTRVEVNGRHHGAKGSTGRVSRKTTFRANGHEYFTVRLTGGKAAGWTLDFTAGQLDLI